MKKIIIVILTVTIIAAIIAAFVTATVTETATETAETAAENRFQYDYEIVIDSETGVNYILIYEEGDYGIKAMGITPLLDENGEVVITKKGGE